MKYLEELSIGESFSYNNEYYINTQDFKQNRSRLALNLKTGIGIWLSHESMVESIDIFVLDKDNNFVAIREREKTDASVKNTNIF